MESRLELFFQSLINPGGLTNWHATIFILEGEKIESKYLKEVAEIVEYERDPKYKRPWNVSPRWRCQPKSDLCICVDADVVVLDKFSLLLDTCVDKDAVYGVQAWHSPFWNHHEKGWQKVFDSVGLALSESTNKQVFMPWYVNHGLIVVPSKYMSDINEAIKEVSYKVYDVIPGLYYFAQLKTTAALEKLNIPRKLLPSRFNSQNLHDDTVLWHYTSFDFNEVKNILRKKQ